MKLTIVLIAATCFLAGLVAGAPSPPAIAGMVAQSSRSHDHHHHHDNSHGHSDYEEDSDSEIQGQIHTKPVNLLDPVQTAMSQTQDETKAKPDTEGQDQKDVSAGAKAAEDVATRKKRQWYDHSHCYHDHCHDYYSDGHSHTRWHGYGGYGRRRWGWGWGR